MNENLDIDFLSPSNILKVELISSGGFRRVVSSSSHLISRTGLIKAEIRSDYVPEENSNFKMTNLDLANQFLDRLNEIDIYNEFRNELSNEIGFATDVPKYMVKFHFLNRIETYHLNHSFHDSIEKLSFQIEEFIEEVKNNG